MKIFGGGGNMNNYGGDVVCVNVGDFNLFVICFVIFDVFILYVGFGFVDGVGVI